MDRNAVKNQTVFFAEALYLRPRNKSSLPIKGRVYGKIEFSRTLSASELAAAEAFVASKTGVVI
jgi:hypothetical protein